MVNRKQYLRASEVGTQLGVSASSVRRYEERGLIQAQRTPGGQRYYQQEDVDKLLGKNPVEVAVFYCRSSSGSKNSLNNQEKLLSELASPIKIYKESGSGLSENRPKLQRLIEDASRGEFTVLYVTEPDRLSRFGRKWIEELLKVHGVQVRYHHEPDKTDLQTELLQDFMSLLASFSGRFYRLRGKEQKLKLLELARSEVEDAHG